MKFTNEDLETMMAEMEEARLALADIDTQMKELSVTVESKDRVISVTANAEGVISGLKLSGRTWREISAKELGSKITDVVNQAQQEVRQRSAELLASIAPEGVDPVTGLPDEVELESMMKGLVAQFGEYSHE